MTCKNCKVEMTNKYCSNCGQPFSIKRIDKHYILHEISHLIHFEKGFFFTMKELAIRPGVTVKEYITENRNKHMKPIPFLIFTSLIYTFIVSYFHMDSIAIGKTTFVNSSVGSLFRWVEGHWGYSNIIMGGFIAVWLSILFRKYEYNIFEITVLLCYVIGGESMLIQSVKAIFEGSTKNEIINAILGFIGFAYATWAIGQFYDKTKVLNYIKALFAYFLGLITFTFVFIAVGLIIDKILKVL